MQDDKILRAIKRARRIIQQLTWLTLEVGTLIAVIHMIAQSIR